jgi:hypothetical protein
MFNFLKNHPFSVVAHFEYSIVLTFAIPKEILQSHIPECLTLDVYDDKYAFVAVAMVQTNALRPKGFPKFWGNDFFLIGYRIFVRYTNEKGKKLRGLYILKSETDNKIMEYLGSVFTKYKYDTTDILIENNAENKIIKSSKSDFYVNILNQEIDVNLPPNSPFPDCAAARRFAGPLPFTFSYDKDSKQVLIVEGVREHWAQQPIEITDYHFPFLKEKGFSNAVLANAFVIKNIPYSWKKGKVETWKN